MNFNIILWAVVAFLAVTLLLVLLLLFAKAKLTSSGAVKIDINGGDKVLEVESGSTLLNTLSEQGIFLPSACGGKGACGQCKCQVVAGGGEILPTERGFFNRRQINDGWRLGCQVKVKEAKTSTQLLLPFEGSQIPLLPVRLSYSHYEQLH